jgi:protein involved in polysaccharide export with SLBB domain
MFITRSKSGTLIRQRIEQSCMRGTMAERREAPRGRKPNILLALGGHPASAALLLLVLIIGCFRAQAQQEAVWAGPSDVASENYNRVAASAAQIEEVLRRDAGLLVELKRWVAKEATDRGQIVEDSALTDQGVFDRLARDLEFRAVATRLLQRYGFLIPKPNPDSEVGKEQQLILQERQRRLQKALAQEGEKETGTDQGTRAATRKRSSIQEIPERTESLLSRPPLRNPIEEQEIRSQPMIPASMESDSGLAQRPKYSVSGAMDNSGAAGQERSAMAAELHERGVVSPSPSEAAASRPARVAIGSGQMEGAAEDADRPVMIHKANPYADVPSLYDMYQQVSARPPELKRFGIEVFHRGIRDSEQLPMDLPVGPDYVVGPGDGLAVDLWGSVSQRLYRIVDREGRLALPEVGPILVSGHTLAETQQTVQQILRTQFRDISADISLSRLRTIRVYVVGDVEQPGAYDISSLSTPLNALFAAEGPTERGSLRAVKHFRGRQLVQEVDVYDLLLRGVRSDFKRLETGDTLLVSPIGPEVTVEGAVRRPASYELRGEKTLAEVLELAGGILPTATLRKIEVQRVEAHQKRTMLSLSIDENASREKISERLESFVVRDQDEVRVFPIAPYNQEAVYLQGHVLRPGRYSYHSGMKLTELVASYADLLPEPATRYAEIIRLNPPDFRPSVESFDLGVALASPAATPVLQPLDTVRVFSRYDFENPSTVWVGGEVRSPGLYRATGQIHLRDAVHMAGGTTRDALFEYAQVFRYLPDSKLKILSVNLREALAGNPTEDILMQPRDRILVHRNLAKADPPSVYIKGEVDKPGRYPLTTNLRTGDLIRLAGGLKRSAFAESADLTRYLTPDGKQQSGEHVELNIAATLSGDPEHDLPLRDGDVLTIRQLPGWKDLGASATVLGEMRLPGTYGIRPGERLSSVLRRAGGFLPTAYPRGAVLERVDVRQVQEQSRQELIRRIEQEATNVRVSLSESAKEQAELQQAALLQRQRVLESLRQAPVSGRLVINLRANVADFEKSADDIEMRDGDRLFIPKRPNFVLVTGQVYNSNAITWVPRKNAGWYLQQAGGPTTLAEKKAIFIVRANGSVVTGKGEGWWGGGVLSARIEPGDTIVVPEKPIGGPTFWKNLLSVAQIAQSASLAALVATR